MTAKTAPNRSNSPCRRQGVGVTVAAQRLNQSRNALSPQTGGSVYNFSQHAIKELPQGANTQLNQVLLQAPGVAQDSFGQSSRARRPCKSSVPHQRDPASRRNHRIWPGLKSTVRQQHQLADRRVAGPVRPAHRRHGRYQDQRWACSTTLPTSNFMAVSARPSIRVSNIGGSKGRLELVPTGQYQHTDRGRRAADPGSVADSRYL